MVERSTRRVVFSGPALAGCLVVAVRVVAPLPVSSETPAPAPPVCIALGTPVAAALQESPPAEPGRARTRGSAADQGGPPTERELRELVRALELVEVGDEKERSPRALAEGSPLTLERIQSLLSDVAAVLATLQVRETLERLRTGAGAGGEERAWLERTLRGIPDCARNRFAGRGGEAAFTRTLQLVERHRGDLERTLLQAPQLTPLRTPERPERRREAPAR